MTETEKEKLKISLMGDTYTLIKIHCPVCNKTTDKAISILEHNRYEEIIDCRNCGAPIAWELIDTSKEGRNE